MCLPALAGFLGIGAAGAAGAAAPIGAAAAAAGVAGVAAPTAVGLGAAAGGISATTLLAGASLGLTAIGTGVQTAGILSQAKHRQRILRRNAALAEEQAEDAKKRGREAETRHRMAVLQLSGRATTAMAASGVEIGSGTPASLLEEIDVMGELDALTIRSNAEREAWGYRAQAGGYRAQAGLAGRAGAYGAATSLLAGASTMANQWYQYRHPYQSYRY